MIADFILSFITMSGNCKFQEKWLDNVEYKDWLHKDSLNIHNAKCSICHKSFSVSSMGEHSVISHSRGSKHLAFLKTRTSAAGM